MFSPATAVTAGALVFAIGGALLIAQPFAQETGVPGAETTEVPDSVPFTAEFLPSSGVRSLRTETVDGVTRMRDQAWTPLMRNVSDPRLDGRLTYSEDVDVYPGSHSFGSVTYRITNDEGAWQGSTAIVKEGDAYGDGSVVVLVGEGAYEGLYAWMDTTDWNAIRGVVFPAAPPEAPAPPPDE